MNPTKPFIAELHDIGKIVDSQALNQAGIQIRGHTYQNFDFSQLGISPPSSPSWWGQFSGDVKSLLSTKVPLDHLSDVLLTKMADELAASVSRTWGGSKDFERRKKNGEFVTEGLHVLWKPRFYSEKVGEGKNWAAFSTPDQLKMMFKFIDNCNGPDEFFEKYEENLRLTAEDKSAPFNIIDLFTHLELTGKIYRILKRHSHFDRVKKRLVYAGNEIQQIKEGAGGRISDPDTKGKWIYRLLFCKLFFQQSLVRLQDLNIFKKRADLIRNFCENKDTRDYVLFYTDDFICLFLPEEVEVEFKELIKPLLADAFIIVDYFEQEAELNLLTSSMERSYEKYNELNSTKRHLRLYEKREGLNIKSEIQPPLCDSCQMRHGIKRIKDQIHEYLCDSCYDIREMRVPAHDYSEWEGTAAWVKITLDQEQLLKTIHRLFEKYVDTHQAIQGISAEDKTVLKESFRPLAVQIDFVKDYKSLLKAFNIQIFEIIDKTGALLFTEENFLYPIKGYYEFGIFKVFSGEYILSVLNLFVDLLMGYFPECLMDSPIKLSLSVAQVKYPYQEHWRFLSMPENTINIQIPGSLKLNIGISQYKLLREKIKKEDSKLSHFLHRLADIEIETKSNITVMVEILRNRKKFPAFLKLVQNGLSVQQILDFYKLIREGIYE